MGEFFFNKEFLNRLEHLVFLSKKVFVGEGGGDRRSRSYGFGLEYADHRHYNVGDDIRYIDWDLYSRTGKLYTKLFLEDKDININILIDCSRSMSFGVPVKLAYALKLAASLSYIGLSRLDHVGAGYFSDDIKGLIPSRRGKNQLFPIFEFLSSIGARDSTNLSQSLVNFAVKVKTPGLVVILSDFFDEKGYERGLKYLLFRKFEVHLLQILCDEEVAPDISGIVRLQDVEGGLHSNINVDASALNKYQKTLNQYNSKLKSFCDSAGIFYLQSVTNVPFDQFLMKYFQCQH